MGLASDVDLELVSEGDNLLKNEGLLLEEGPLGEVKKLSGGCGYSRDVSRGLKSSMGSKRKHKLHEDFAVLA